MLMKETKEWKFAQEVWLLSFSRVMNLNAKPVNATPWHFHHSMFTCWENLFRTYLWLCKRAVNKVCFHLNFQNFPSCSINIESFQKLPKICSTWSLWCKENEEGETAGNNNSSTDQSTSQSSINLVRVPPKRPRLRMPFRRRNWCGCIQVRKYFDLCLIGKGNFILNVAINNLFWALLLSFYFNNIPFYSKNVK